MKSQESYEADELLYVGIGSGFVSFKINGGGA